MSLEQNPIETEGTDLNLTPQEEVSEQPEIPVEGAEQLAMAQQALAGGASPQMDPTLLAQAIPNNLWQQATPLIQQGQQAIQNYQQQQQQQAYPEQQQQQQPEEPPPNFLSETGAALIGGGADAVESVSEFADLTGDTLRLGLNQLLGIDTEDEENPFHEGYEHGAGIIDIPDNWIPENKTGLGKFGRGLVEFGLLTWATGGVGGTIGSGARLGTRGLAIARSAGAGLKGTRQIKFIAKGVKIGSEGAIADLISSSSENANIMNLANEHVPWMVPWIGDALAIDPEDNPWLARIKTVASGAGMNYIGHGIAAYAKGSWAAGRAAAAGKTVDEANTIGNKVMDEDMAKSLDLDEQAHVEMAVSRYGEGKGLSRADPYDEYLRKHLSEDEYRNYSNPRMSQAYRDQMDRVADSRGRAAGDVFERESGISTGQLADEAGREVDPFVNDGQFDGYERATLRAEDNAAVKHVRESLVDRKNGGEGRSYSPIMTESYLRAISRGDRNIREYIEEVANDITDAAFANVDNRLDWDQTKQLVLKQASELLDVVENGGDIAKTFKNSLDDPENFRVYADDGNRIVTISPTQKAANVLVLNALAKQVQSLATSGLAIDKLPIGRQAESLFDSMKVLMIENKKMGMNWGLDGKAQQAFVLSPTMKAAKNADMAEISKQMDEYFGQLHKLHQQGRYNELRDLMELHALSQGKVRTLAHIHEFLKAKWRGGRMDGIHIRGRVRQQLQSTFFNSILSGLRTAPKAIIGTNMLAMLRPFQGYAGAMLLGNEKEMVIAVSQIDALGKAFAEGWEMWKHNWDLGVHRKSQTYQGKFDVGTDLQEWKSLGRFYEEYGEGAQSLAYGALDKLVDFNTSPWVKYSQNAMGSGDAMARTVIGRMTMRQRAARAAIEAGVPYDDVVKIARKTEDNFRNEVFKRDKDGMWVVSDKGASMAGDEAAMTRALEENFKGFELISNIPGMKAFFPFVRTGFNYLDVSFQHTELARFGDKFKDLTNPNGPRNLAKYGIRAEDVGQEIALMKGRMAMGNAVIGMGTIAAMSGMMTGDLPYTREEQQLWRKAGIKPKSFRIGDKYVSYDGLEVFDTLFSMTANVVQNSNLLGEELTDHWIKKLTFIGAATIVENSMLSGVEDLARLMNPQTSEELIKRTGSRMIRSHLPYAGLMGSLGNILDETRKESETLWELIIKRDALFKSTLPPKYDILSRDRSGKRFVPDPAHPLLRVFNNISPIAITNIDDDPVKQALVAIRYNLPQTLSTYKGEPLNSLERSEMEKYLSMGDLRQELEIAIKNYPDFQRTLDEYRNKGLQIDEGYKLRNQRFYMIIDQIFRRNKEIAMNQVLRNNPDLARRVNIRKKKEVLTKAGAYDRLLYLPSK